VACEQAGMPPALVAIDTLSKTFGAGKENTDDMVSYVNNCQRVASHFQCLSLVVHHRPKDSESKDMRGHSSLRGNVDTTILIEAGQVKTATTLKQKDGEDNVQIRFTLDRLIIGEDKRGKEISTCLLNIVDGAAPADDLPPAERRKQRLTGHKKVALNAIEEVIAKDGREPSGDIPGDLIDRFKTWKAAGAGQVSDRLKSEFYALEDGDEDKRRDNARRNANRVLKGLKSDGIIGSWEAWIWVN
jgi:AAA domain